MNATRVPSGDQTSLVWIGFVPIRAGFRAVGVGHDDLVRAVREQLVKRDSPPVGREGGEEAAVYERRWFPRRIDRIDGAVRAVGEPAVSLGSGGRRRGDEHCRDQKTRGTLEAHVTTLRRRCKPACSEL